MAILLKLAAGLFALYALVVLGMWLGQRRLIYPATPSRVAPEQLGLLGVRELELRTPDAFRVASLLGSVLRVGLLWATVRYGVSGYLSTEMLDTAFIGMADVWAIAPIVVGGIAVLAVCTSAVTLRRYLRV